MTFSIMTLSNECRYAECRYDSCRDYFNVMPSVVMLNVVTPSVAMLNVIMPSVVMLNVVVLNVVAPFLYFNIPCLQSFFHPPNILSKFKMTICLTKFYRFEQ